MFPIIKIINFNFEMKKRKYCDFSPETRGKLCVLGGICIQLFNGCFFMWANISIYVISYIYKFNPDIRIDTVFFVDFVLLQLNVVGYNIGMYLLNYRKWTPRSIVFLGGFIALTGKFLSSFTVNIWLFITLYGFLGGIGNGITYMMPLVCSWEHFPERKGFVTGIIVGSYGLGSFIFNLLSTKLVNPHNEEATVVIDAETHYFEWSVA